MNATLRFLANERLVETGVWPGTPALDFIRRELGLVGTKEGCREGDCGACSVLVGERESPEATPRGASRSGAARYEGARYRAARYRAMPSCLLALGELEGRHLITIEGLAAGGNPGPELPARRLTPVMRALLAENGSQCGFCTPGFVIALTAFLLQGPPLSEERAAAAIDGNLCRCTGYASILRAARRLEREFADLPADPLSRFEALAQAGVVPPSLPAFARGEIPIKVEAESGAAGLGAGASFNPSVGTSSSEGPSSRSGPGRALLVLGGGSDFYVRNPSPEPAGDVLLLDRDPRFLGIEARGEGRDARVIVGAAVSWSDFFASPFVRAAWPGIERFESLLASTLVRNRATIGGNVANASPVGDLCSMLIALGAQASIQDLPEDTGAADPDATDQGAAGPEAARPEAGREREIMVEDLFLGYKRLDLRPGEIIASFSIPCARDGERRLFNFEKVSKRRKLDIAAVNSAALFELKGDRITRARLSAGGVAPTPLLLRATSSFLEGRLPDAATASEAAALAASEATPISDARGSADYRRRLLARLVLAHFAVLFGTEVLP